MSETFIKQFKIDDLSVCDGLIDYFKQNQEYKFSGETNNGLMSDKKSTDVNVFNQSKDLRIKKYFSYLSKFVIQYLNHYNLDISLFTKEAFNIQYYKPGEGFLKWHFERNDDHYLTGSRALVFMTYLNNVKDGGGKEFLHQKKVFKAKKGHTLLWPSDFTHTHRGIVSKTEEKYIATGWFHFSNLNNVSRVNK